MGGMDGHEETKGTDADARPSLGDFIAAQRRAAELSLRQLAERAGISNPYISQIERGLRKPSAEVLQSLARALQVSSGTLYSYAGLLEPEAGEGPTSVAGAIRSDPLLSDSQKQALVEIYRVFTASPDAPPAP